MNRLMLSNNNKDKKIITFTINKIIKSQLREALINDKNYNLKRKSDWVYESILMLKKNVYYKQIVCNAEGNNDEFVHDKIYMTFSQRCTFNEMRNEIVKMYPDIRGPQAAILRAAILSRLMRKA